MPLEIADEQAYDYTSVFTTCVQTLMVAMCCLRPSWPRLGFHAGFRATLLRHAVPQCTVVTTAAVLSASPRRSCAPTALPSFVRADLIMIPFATISFATLASLPVVRGGVL